MQIDGTQPHAKADTVFLALDGAITEDRSRFAEDLAPAGLGAWESPSPRAALAGERTIEIRGLFEAAKNATLAQHGNLDGTARTWWVGFDEQGHIAVGQGDTPLHSLPSPASPPPWDLTIAWSTRPNVDAAGPSEALRSELTIYDHGAQAWSLGHVFTHPEPVTSVAWALSLGGRWNGGELLDAAAQVLAVARLSTRFHSSVELGEDWAGPRPPIPLSYPAKAEGPPAVWRGDGALGEVDQVPGALNAASFAAAAEFAQLRGWSPLVNEVLADRPTWDNSYSPPRRFTLAPGATVHRMGVHWLRWVTLPDRATHARIRVHVTCWVEEGPPVPISWRCYSLNRPPVLDVEDPEEPSLAADLAQASLEVDHGEGGLGEWLTLGTLELQRYAGAAELLEGTTHLVLAYAVDPEGQAAEAEAEAARWRLNAWTVEPLYSPAPTELLLGVNP